MMHGQQELDKDLGYEGVLPDRILSKWFNCKYSTSKHLMTLYSIVRGLNAKSILEIGFGRSTFVLAKATSENKGTLTSCDIEDFSYLLSEKKEKLSNSIMAILI